MKRAVRYILALLITSLCFYYWEYLIEVTQTVDFTNNIILLPLAVGIFCLVNKSLQKDRKYYRYVMPLGLFCGFALVLGTQLTRMYRSVEMTSTQTVVTILSTAEVRMQHLNFHSISLWMACLTYSVLFGTLFGRLFAWLDKKNAAAAETAFPGWLKRLMDGKHFHWVSQAFMLVSWLPVWLASYPGFFCYDVGIQYDMFVSGTVDRHHPVLHTWLIGLFLTTSEKLTGSANPGIAVLTWVQMIFLSAVFSYVLWYMKKSGAKRLAVLGGLLVFSFLPTIQIYVGCTTKDLIYTGFFMLLIIKMIQWIREPETYWKPLHRKIQLGVILFFCMAFRNNALYIVIVFMALALIWLKVRRKMFYAIAASAVVCYLLFNGPFLNALGVGSGNVREMLSVPIQQLGRVYIQNTETYSEEDLELMFRAIPKTSWDCYQPKTADAIKNDLDQAFFEENKWELFKLWASTGLENPGLYLEAFLLLTVDSWCPNSILDGHVGYFYDREAVQSCYYTPQVDEPGVLESKIPWLYDKIVDIGYHISFQNVPVLSMVFSVGAMLWLYLTVLAYTIYRRQRQFWLPLLLVGLYYCTHLLGPMVLVRYHLILFFMIPVYFWMLSAGQKADTIKGEERTE